MERYQVVPVTIQMNASVSPIRGRGEDLYLPYSIHFKPKHPVSN